MMIEISNKGEEVAHTNYFDSDYSKNGFSYLSWNAGSGRLLVADASGMIPRDEMLREICDVKKATIETSISQTDAYDLVFEDGSESPFFIAIPKQLMDRGISGTIKRSTLYVYTREGLLKKMPLKIAVR